MAQAIKSGDAGEITRVAMRCHLQTWPRAWQQAGDWLSGRADGGFVREVISHFIYMMEVVLGSVEVEWSNVTYPDDGAGSEMAIMAGLNIEGVPVQVTGSVGGAAPDVVECTFYGTQRSYRSVNWGTLMIGTADGWDEEIVEDGSQRAQTLFGALARLIDGKDHGLPEFSVGLKVQQVIETMLEG